MDTAATFMASQPALSAAPRPTADTRKAATAAKD